jgi:hypothetical protein
MAVRGKVGDDAEGVFSEGRGLRVRIARHHEWRGPSLPPEVRREAGGLIGIHGEGVRPSSRACRARPSAGGLAQHGWPCGERSEMTPRESSRRGALCAPTLPGRTQTEARHDQRGQTNARGPSGAVPRSKRSLLCRRPEPAFPPRCAWKADDLTRYIPESARCGSLGREEELGPQGDKLRKTIRTNFKPSLCCRRRRAGAPLTEAPEGVGNSRRD